MLPSSRSILKFALCLSFLIFSSTSQASVNTFKYFNTGPLNNFGEYGSTYRPISFQESYNGMIFCFYNTTPNAYTLALATDPEPHHWVWSANPNDPVQDGATITLADDGNLILADVDGHVVWQSNTSNKGVVSLVTRTGKSYGNLVLVDANDNPVWQSFDHPTDTLFPSQLLSAAGPKKLVSRASSSGGYYSMAIMPNRLSFYYKSSPNKTSKLVVYYTLFKTRKTLKSLEFHAENNKPSFIQSFADGTQASFEFADLTFPEDEHNYQIMAYFLRLQNDGNLRIYIFRRSVEMDVWYAPYQLFANGLLLPSYDTQVSDCQLPEKCGNFGVCYNHVCKTCPTAKGIVPWTDKCEPPKLGGCGDNGKSVTYFKVDGVEHFSTNFTKGEGRMVQSLCEKKCSTDCKCLGYFYHKENSRCWIVYDLKTLIGTGNVNHSGYVKMSS